LRSGPAFPVRNSTNNSDYQTAYYGPFDALMYGTDSLKHRSYFPLMESKTSPCIPLKASDGRLIADE
jgi:hypothetical protein